MKIAQITWKDERLHSVYNFVYFLHFDPFCIALSIVLALVGFFFFSSFFLHFYRLS